MKVLVPIVGLLLCWVSLSPAESQKHKPDTKPDTYAQKLENVCGQYCLARALRHFGRNVEFAELLNAIPISPKGSNLAQLKVVAEAYGLRTLGARVSGDILFSMHLPAILHVNDDHFVLLLPEESQSTFILIDPLESVEKISRSEQLETTWKWKGNCLFLNSQEIRPPIGESQKQTGYWHYFGRASVPVAITIVLIGGAFLLKKRKRSFTHMSILPVFLCILLGTFGFSTRTTAYAAKDVSAHANPRISVDNPVFDAGIVYDDTQKITHTFILKNTGDVDLIIKKIKTACSCMTAATDKKQIPPGRTMPLKVHYNLQGRYGKLALGTTVVITNDPETPVTKLIIQGERKHEFIVRPPQVSMGPVPIGTGKILLLKIVPGADHIKLRLDKAKPPSPFLKIEQIDSSMLKPDRPCEYLLKIHLLPTAPAGIFRERITIPCSGSRRKNLNIPVLAEVVGPIKISTPKIAFGLIHPNDKERFEKILLHSGRPFEILKCVVDQPWAQVTKEKMANNKFQLSVKIIPSKAPLGKQIATITLQTNIDSMKKIAIPVYVFCLQPIQNYGKKSHM